MCQRNYFFETHNKAGERTSKETELAWRRRVMREWLAVPHEKLAMVFHDRDKLEDGTPKGLHAHLLLFVDTPKTCEQMMSRLNISLPQNVAFARNPVASAKYLTHITDIAIKARKFIYSQADVITSNCTYHDLLQPLQKPGEI